MGIYIGADEVAAAYYGADPIQRIYLGADQIWPAAALAPTDITWHAAWWAEHPNGSPFVDGNPVSPWTDMSGNGFDIATGTSGFRPLYEATGIGGQPTIIFDGTNDRLFNTNLGTWAPGDPVTLVLVGTLRSIAGAVNMVSGSLIYTVDAVLGDPWGMETNHSGDGATTTTGWDSSPHVHIAVFDDTSSKIVLDGTELTWASLPPDIDTAAGWSPFSFTLASSVPADIAFAGIYDGAMTPAQISGFSTWAISHYSL